MPTLADESSSARDNFVGRGSCRCLGRIHRVLCVESVVYCTEVMVCEEICTAVLFGSVMVVCVYALYSARGFEEYERFMRELMKMMTGGRKEGAKRFFVAGDLNIELEFFCMDEDDEMKEIYAPKCGYGIDADLGGFKKAN